MQTSSSSSEHKSSQEAGNPAHPNTALYALSKLFGDLPDDTDMPPLPLTPVSQSLQVQPSHRDRLSLSRSLSHSESSTPPNSSKPPTPRAEILMVPTPRDPQGMVNDGVEWVAQLITQMHALSELSDETRIDLLNEVPSLELAKALATQETLAQRKKLAGRRFRTSMHSALVMYWLTFGLGKVVGNVYSAAMVASGLPAAALYAPLFSAIGVPFVQVIFGEPYGGALRSAGVTYGSPDQAAYINHQTAHALYIRAWLEANKDDEEKYRKIMNGIVDGLIKREQSKKPDGESRIPKHLRSNASVPDRHPDGTVKPGHTDPSSVVVGAARTRSFITDEVPVHTFTVLNGMSGFANLFWKLFMGDTMTRVPDMVAHTFMGSIAMVSMFEWQNVWRAHYQGVDLSDGAHPAVLGAQKEAARVTVEMWRKRLEDAYSLIKKIEDMLNRVDEYRQHHDHTDSKWNDILTLRATLEAAHRQMRRSLADIKASSKRAKKELSVLTTRSTRADKAAKRIMSSMVGGESSAPEPWLAGAPLRIRSVSRVFGYMTVLSATAAQAILLGMSLMDYSQELQDGRALASQTNSTLVTEPLNMLGLTSTQMAVASVNASTVAATAIVGWTAKTLYGLPLWEHGIHGIAGIATRALKETRKCLGLTPDTTLPEHTDLEAGNRIEPIDVAAYSSDEESSDGQIELPAQTKSNTPGGSSSSSSSDHH